MKFSGKILIDKPRDIVVNYFADPKYLCNYQTGFLKKELVSGEMSKDGAVSKMYYKYGKGEMELTETIVSNQLPDSFESNYHHKNMDNYMKCRFIEVDSQKTRYEYEYGYTRISGFIPRLIAKLFPSVYRNQAEKWIKQFKEFVEKQ